MKKKEFRLRLRGKTVVLVDWANVWGWRGNLKAEVDPKKLWEYFSGYREVGEMRLYFGTDKTHPKSGEFLKNAKKTGYFVVTKEVKFIKIYDDDKKSFFWKRKCDLDLELGLDALEMSEKYQSFIILSGDGDYATLYERLIKRKKQVIVVYAHGNLGREIWKMERGVFKVAITRFGVDVFTKKMPPGRRPGARLGEV